MYGGRKTLVFVLFSIGAGSLLWISALYFRRKRRQRSAITEGEVHSSLPSEEKPRGPTRRIPGLRTRSQLRNKTSLDSKAGGNSARQPKIDEAIDRNAMIPDGKASGENPGTSESPLEIYRCINQGVEEFKFAMEHWYQATRHYLEQQDQDDVLNRVGNQDEMMLRTIMNCSQQLRMAIVRHGLADNNSYAVLPRNVLLWMQNEEEVIQERILHLEERSPSEDSDSDNDSFLSASETAALEFDDLIEERFISDSSQLKMFRQTILKAAGQYSHLDFYVLGLEHYARYEIECRKMRTEVVGCESDMEFLAKVVCIREASELAFSSPDNCTWMADTGRFLLSSIIESTGKDPTDFEAAFDELLEYCAKPENWKQIEEELLGRRVS